MDPTITKIIEMGGLGGALILSIWVNYKFATNHSVHSLKESEMMRLAMDRNTDAFIDVAAKLQKVIDKIDDMIRR